MEANLNFDRESPLFKNREEALNLTYNFLKHASEDIENYVNSLAALGYYSYYASSINSLFNAYTQITKLYRALKKEDVEIEHIQLKLF